MTTAADVATLAEATKSSEEEDRRETPQGISVDSKEKMTETIGTQESGESSKSKLQEDSGLCAVDGSSAEDSDQTPKIDETNGTSSVRPNSFQNARAQLREVEEIEPARQQDLLLKTPAEDIKKTDDLNDPDSQAAVALAAVAAAASASHSSPSAAADAARALAPGIVPAFADYRHRELKSVDLPAVKNHLGRIKSNSALVQVLASGQNDRFLQHLLLLQFFETEDQSLPGTPRSLSGIEEDADQKEAQDEIRHEEKFVDYDLAAVAAENVIAMLDIIDRAYESIVNLLPSLNEPERLDGEDESANFDGIEAPFFVPDLLPPCISTPGDATIEFFLACSGVSVDPDKTPHESGEESAPRKGESDCASAEPGTSNHDATSPRRSSAPSSVFSFLSSSKRDPTPRSPRASFPSVFRKRRNNTKEEKDDKNMSSLRDDDLLDGEYAVVIEREMLGLTVENVLERTVVRTVLQGGAAKKAGAKVGSLIVRVGNVETKNLTHFETIDELRQSNRPLRLVMRQISNDGLRLAREEMGRLIRGGGFGNLLDGGSGTLDNHDDVSRQQGMVETRDDRSTSRAEVFWQLLRARCSNVESQMENKKEMDLLYSGEKLIWILSLLVIGLEREAVRLRTLGDEKAEVEMLRERHSHYRHSSKDFTDAAKSTAKVLYDFVRWRVSPPQGNPEGDVMVQGVMDRGAGGGTYVTRKGRRVTPPPPPPGAVNAPGRAKGAVSHSQTSLFRIGDVLHRTRSFLADPTSPPAAMLRSEVIAFLCDILDIDTGMELAEEEAASSTAGGASGPISDLGSAGSLLKLIVLSCSMMRSPECVADAAKTAKRNAEALVGQRQGQSSTMVDLHRMHAGNRFLAVVHRLAASRSVSARVTACSLGPVLWGHLDFPHQLQLRGVITRALHDVDVSVRKSTATVLHEIAELVFDPRSVPWLVLMCERAMTDPEPQLRSAAMTLTWHLAEHLPNAFLGDASKGSRSVSRLPPRTDPMFAEVYLLQCKLLPVATRLAEDRAPSVRLAVAAQCDRLCFALGEHWFSVIIDVLQSLLSDLDERVRGEAVLCVPRLVEHVLLSSTAPYGSLSGGVGVLESLLPLSVKLQKDLSSSVRVALATAAGELLTLLVGLQTLDEVSSPRMTDTGSIGSESSSGFKQHKRHVDETLIPLLQQLLHDLDPEVTSAALRAVTNASRGNVREIQARRRAGTGETDDDTLSLSSYQSHASTEKKDPVFIPVLSETQVLRLIPTLSELAKSRQWRVRQGAVEIVPALLGCTHKIETRAEIAKLCIHLMSDKVDAVRRTAAECLCLGGGSLGSHGESSGGEWISTIVIPQVRICSQHNDSKQRMLSLKMIEAILVNGMCPAKKVDARAEGEEEFADSPLRELLQVVVSLSADSVANVRLNVGRVLGDVFHVFDEEDLNFVVGILQNQIEDEASRGGGADRDVLFFARRSLSRAQSQIEGACEGSISTTADNETSNT